ncbi:uncharacterized protein LOC141660747 [Apium graveolens]|uniref:uncharacterized protein LOC141660747 n=1 Tax=Apium graveolens TaxID=4045 RepID=UPI003D79C96D
MRQEQHIDVTLNRHSDQIKKEYRIRLGASIDCIRFLLRQGLALHGHDESDESTNQGNFLEFLKFLADHCKEIDAVVGKNAPNNLKVTSPDIQHDIINASAVETINSIIGDLGDNLFSILIDESRDISIKEQMIILQLTLVAIAKNDIHVGSLFNMLAILVNVIGASCKRRDMLRERQVAHISEALTNGELISGHGLNQETNVKRAGDTRWGTHYHTLVSVISMFESIVDVLDFIVEDGLNSEQRDNLKMKRNQLSGHQKRQKKLKAAEAEKLQMGSLDKFFGKKITNSGDIGVPIENTDIRKESDKRYDIVGAELFNELLVLRMLQKLNNHFSESSMELLICIACLSPNNAFSAFDKEKLLRLAQFYPSDYSSIEPTVLDNQLTSVERGFSAMKIVKNRLRNRMEDQLLNDSLITYIEKSVFDGIVNEAIMQRFQNMKNHRGQL